MPNFRGDLPPGSWDYEPLNGCWPRGIRPSDLDGIVEIQNRFLVWDVKPSGYRFGDGSRGQEKLLTRLAKQPNTSAVVLYGDSLETVEEMMWATPDGWQDREEIDLEVLIARFKHWATS